MDCKHIIGYAEGAGYDSWLIYYDERQDFMEEKFNYCPLCGEQIDWSKENG